MIPQHYPLYIREGDERRLLLVVGWLPDKVSGLPRQPVVLLCEDTVTEPRVLEQTTPFTVVGTNGRG